jgi:hypothetical protein
MTSVKPQLYRDGDVCVRHNTGWQEPYGVSLEASREMLLELGSSAG